MAGPSGSVDLVRRLVDRAVSGIPGGEDAASRRHLLSLALRLLGSGVGLSSSPRDEVSVAESIRDAVRGSGQGGRATRFDELHAGLMGMGLEAEFRTRVLAMLLLVARDRGRVGVLRAETSLRASWVAQDAGGLRALRVPMAAIDANAQPPLPAAPRQPRAAPQKQLAPALGEPDVPLNFGVNEPSLVRDVLYVCQGIDGAHVRFDPYGEPGGGFMINPEAAVSPVQAKLILRLCELGWLFRRVHGYLHGRWGRMGGAVRQALGYAVSKELADYYRLMAVLEAQLDNPMPTALDHGAGENDPRGHLSRPNSAGGGPGGPYLSLRRLAVWLAEPMRRMRLLGVIIDSTRDKSGGELAGAVYSYLHQGDPTTHAFTNRMLQRVRVPVLDMIKQWVFEGELYDPYGEFFVRDAAESLEEEGGSAPLLDLWREGYRIDHAMLPAYISEPLARQILRAGKTINFLRERCQDGEWVQERATEAQASGMVSAANGQMEGLQGLVDGASASVDQRLLDILFQKYSFSQHCEAMKRYLLLGQGDFIQALMDLLRPELDKEAKAISEITLIGLLKSAVHASNAKYEDDDVLERLRVRKDKGIGRDTGWDVFSLQYDMLQPMATIFTPSVMNQYLRVFRLLWKLKHAEHTLAEAWHTLKLLDRVLNTFGPKSGDRARSLLRLGLKLRSKMSHFVTNLQYYVMFEVLEGAWGEFTQHAHSATDLDELIAAHEQYLDAILTRSLLIGDVAKIHMKLEEIFSCVFRLLGVVNRLSTEVETAAQVLKAQKQKVQRRTRKGGWGIGKGDAVPEKDIPEKEYADIKRVADNVGLEYEVLLNQFTKDLPVQALSDLRFLVFRLDVTEFYTEAGAESTQDDEFDG